MFTVAKCERLRDHRFSTARTGWGFDVHNRPSTSTAGAPGLARIREDAGAAGTGTSTLPLPLAPLAPPSSQTSKFDIDWSLTNDEFDAWMEGDTSNEDDEGGSDQRSACNLFYPFKQDKFGDPGQYAVQCAQKINYIGHARAQHFTRRAAPPTRHTDTQISPGRVFLPGTGWGP